MKKGTASLILFATSIFIVSLAGQAMAGTLDFDLNITFTGSSPSGAPHAQFDDSYGGLNTVRLTMDASGLSGTEGILQWYFNFDPGETASYLTLTYVSGATATTEINQDNLKADGDGYFDFAFRFADEPDGLGPDSNDLTSVYDITYTSPISANSFNFFSASGGGTGVYLSAAQVNDIGGDDQFSGWVGAVPEPVSSTLFLIGAATLGFRRFRKK